MVNEYDQRIKNITERIAREYDPERIIMFGSHAWGNPNDESDVDLFVVKDTDESVAQRHKRVNMMLFGAGIPIDVLVYTPRQVQRQLNTNDVFVKHILSHGKTLYDKAR